MDNDPLAVSLDETTAEDGVPEEPEEEFQDNLEGEEAQETQEAPKPRFSTLEEATRAYEEAHKTIGRQGYELGQLRKQTTPEAQVTEQQYTPEQQLYIRLKPQVDLMVESLGIDETQAWTLAQLQERQVAEAVKNTREELLGRIEQVAGPESYVPSVTQALERVSVPGITAQEIASAMKQQGISLTQFQNSPAQLQDQFVETFGYNLLGRKAAKGQTSLKPPPQNPPRTGSNAGPSATATRSQVEAETEEIYRNELHLDDAAIKRAMAEVKRQRGE